MTRSPRRWALAGTGATVAATAAVALTPTAADAHSLESSTVSVHVTEDGADATISIALETLDRALGTDYTSETAVTAYSDEITAYLADHLTATGADGTEWAESYSTVTRETVEGIDSVTVDVTLDPGTSDASTFDLAYDAVIEAVPDHEVVVVLTDAEGDISTPGVLTSADDTLTLSTGSSSDDAGATTGLVDMIGYGFHHVLEGADHLLFLVALLLTAPVAWAAGRWQARAGAAATLREVLGIVTAFTVGHSITLISAALGWVDAPSQPVEILIALSVGVAAIHAIRPLVRSGERMIAFGFGLVHGLAFAGVLAGLGLSGSTSVLMLLAFNIGVELAQITAALLFFPSLWALARTRFYPRFRVGVAGLALVAATAWIVERVGLFPNPLGFLEDAAIAHPWYPVLGVAALAVLASLNDAERHLTGRPSDARHPASGPQLP